MSSQKEKSVDEDSRPQPQTRPVDLALISNGRIVVVGLGGIGSFLVTPLTMFLAALRNVRVAMNLIDGDRYEERNRERMEVPELGNKAEVLCGRLSTAFARPKLYIRPIDQFVNQENVDELIVERDVVLSCVDNHATRKLLSKHCEKLNDVVLISGGNDGVDDDSGGTYGNIQVFRRRAGEELNVELTRFHPEILDPADRPPSAGCADLSATVAPQLLWTNFFAAATMGIAFQRLLTLAPGEPMYDEACFDISKATLLPHFLAHSPTESYLSMK